ncbi:hypothetical protein DRE_02370 [Drechslerella stenobrocha 248]|uniref:Wings apart-like protein C-terminal domain-containing protein n=1 Tax=Drechslerella stenobrocha 248 TaxID=1043628 RepID=W7HVP5_9PEZI|nr:hypothetical protein DRE_02370 [Drechslerella stenobrocha 248]
MRQRKSYGGSRHSGGLKDEYNDIFKSRAMEKKGITGKKPTESAATASGPQTQTKSNRTLNHPNPTTNGAAKPPALEPRLPKKPQRDVFDLESSDDDDDDARNKNISPAKQPATKSASLVTTTAIANGIANGRAAPKGKSTTKATIVISDSSDNDSELVKAGKRQLLPQKLSKPVPATTPLETKKKPSEAPKRKNRASTDSESDYGAIAKNKKNKSSKIVIEKRKHDRADVDDVAEKPMKRQDRTAKSYGPLHRSSTKDMVTKKQADTSRKPNTQRQEVNGKTKLSTEKQAAAGNTIKATKKAIQDKSTDVEMISVDPVYDHAVDISYNMMPSPTLKPKKPPTLMKEPSAVEMPSVLTELIESRVAEIEEQPAKKPKRPISKARRETQITKEADAVKEPSKEEAETGSREVESQAQIQAAMFSADYGVRTTRSKFRNEGAAKKSYGVAQRTMRQPVTEEEQKEDQKLEIIRSLEMAEIREYRKMQAERKQQDIAAAAAAAAVAPKGGKKINRGNLKGKGRDEFDDEDDGPKVMSRHALLQKGRHQRVLNEIDALMEDAEKENPTRRSSILDVAHRMSNNTEDGKEFVQKFRLNGYDSKLLKNLDQEQDELTRIGYGWIIFILLNEEIYSGRITDLMLDNGGFDMLKTMLTSDADLDELAKSSALKFKFQIDLVTGKLRTRLLQCRFIRTNIPGPFSQRYVALMIINTMLKGVGKAEGHKLILDQFDPRQFVEILGPLTRHIAPPVGPGLTNYFLSLSTLGYYSQIGRFYEPLNDVLEPGHLVVLSNTLPTVLEWQVFDTTENVDRVKEFQIAVLKLCADRTMDDPTTSIEMADYRNGVALVTEACIKQFKTMSEVSTDEKDLSNDIQLLCVTGVLLSNLLEHSEAGRQVLRLQKSGGVPLIECLMEIFADRHDRLALAESVEETHLNVGFGYLTVAIAHACKDYDIRGKVRARFQGSLEPLVLAVMTLKQHYQQLEDLELAASQRADDFGERASLNFSYTSHLEDILEGLRAY